MASQTKSDSEQTPTRIGKAFAGLREKGKKGFIAYIQAGDPSLKDTGDIVRRLADAGADVIELGIPFSDPLADGRVNQEAAERALAAGTNVKGVFEMVQAVRRDCDVPILCYSYMNPLFAYGFKKMARDSASVGVDAFLLLDLSMEEAHPYFQIMKAASLDNICLVTPTSKDARIRKIVKQATGFVYCVSRTGVTGIRDKVEKGAVDVVERTRKATALPVALGFGISTPEQAQTAARMADAVVVGSMIVKAFHDAPHTAEGRASATRRVRKLIRAIKAI